MNKSLILEELKRINFITNYGVGDLVSENESKKENILFEQKINNLFEPKKTLITEAASSAVLADLKAKLTAQNLGTYTPKLALRQNTKTPTALDVYGYKDGKYLTFFPDGTVKWWDGKKYSTGGKWDFTMLKNGKLSGGWLKNKDGTNVSLVDGIGYPSKNFGDSEKGFFSSYLDNKWQERVKKLKDYLTINKPASTTLKQTSDGKKVYLEYKTGQNLEFWESDGKIYFSTGGKGDIDTVTAYGNWGWDDRKNKPYATTLKNVNLDFSKVLSQPYETLITQKDVEFTGLYDRLKNNGIPVKYGVDGKETTDSSKATFIYWGGWVINKDNTANSGWPITFNRTDNFISYFKFKGGKFAGSTKVVYGGGPKDYEIDLVDYGKGTNESITEKLKEIAKLKDVQKAEYEKKKAEIAKKADLAYTNIVKAFDYDNDGVDDDYDWTNEELAAQAVEMIDSREVLDIVNAKIKARGYYSDIAAWFKDEMSSIDPYEYDRVVARLNKLGYKLEGASSLGYIAAYTVGVPLTAVDRTVTAIQDKTNYANKQTQGAVAKYSKKQVEDILNKEVSPSIDFLAQLLLNATTWFGGDDEAIVEKAFSRINTKERYNQLKAVMGQDPYKFVKSFYSNTYLTYGKQSLSVDGSYNAIFQSSIKELTGFKDKPNLIFTAENPAGTTKTFVGTPMFYKIAERQIKDPYLVGGKGIVPGGFLWGANLSIYPDPQPYSTALINQYNLGREKYTSPKTGEMNTNYNSISKDKFYIADQMSRWNTDLANQEKMIPKYCATTFKYQPTVKQQQQVSKEAYKTVDVPVGDGTDISMAAYCKDFGGLWVYDSQKSSPYCGCRDKNNQFLSSNLKVIDKTTGKEGVVNISKGFKENTSINWSHPDSVKNIAKYTIQAVSTLAAIIYPPLAPIINLVAGVTNTTIALSQEKKAEAAIFVLFDILPGIKGLGISKAVAENLAKKVASGAAESLVATEAQTLNKIINYQNLITDNVKDTVKNLVKSGEISEFQGRIATQLTKNMEKEIHDKLGTQDITQKGIAKTVAKELDKDYTYAKVRS